MFVFGVVNVLVWHRTQPMLLNCVSPFLVEAVDAAGLSTTAPPLRYTVPATRFTSCEESGSFRHITGLAGGE